MAQRTWLPKLLFLLLELCAYIGRWRNQVDNHIGEAGIPLLDAVLAACVELSDYLEEVIGHGT